MNENYDIVKEPSYKAKKSLVVIWQQSWSPNYVFIIYIIKNCNLLNLHFYSSIFTAPLSIT